MIKRILLLVIALMCASCGSDIGVEEIYYFPCIRAFYEDVVLKNPDLYPEYSHEEYQTNPHRPNSIAIFYEHSYTLTKEKDGIDGERSFKLAITQSNLESDSGAYNYLSYDTGTLCIDGEYVIDDYVFNRYSPSVKIEKYHGTKKSTTLMHDYPGGFRKDNEHPLNDDLRPILQTAIREIVVNECLKKVDKYCKENEKGIYENGKYKWFNLYPE